MEELAKKLGITQEGVLQDDRYIIDLHNSDEYSNVYTTLDNSDLVELDGDSTLVTDKVSELTYLADDDIVIKLVANFKDDVYKVIFEKEE